MNAPNKRGFTLIEVLTVIAIIGILASLGGYTYAATLTRSRDNQRIADLQFIRNGLEQFYVDNRSYPIFQGDGRRSTATWQLEQLPPSSCQTSTKFLAPKYITQLPQDPSHKFATPLDCNTVPDKFGQYLYYGLNKPDSKKGFYLMARMERAQNINYESEVGTVLSGSTNNYQDLPIFCNADNLTEQCSQNYFVTNSKNN